MAKGIRLFSVFCFLFIINPVLFGQDAPKTEYDKRSQPISIVKRLSYENFKNIKLLHIAIVNFGEGEAQFDKLVDDYADASALYFSNKILKSANLFTKNEKDILKAAIDLSKKYKTATEQIQRDIIRLKIKGGIKASFKGKKLHGVVDKIVHDASFAMQKANDLHVRTRPVDAIYYYRLAKTNFFKTYKILNSEYTKFSDESTKKDDKEFFNRLANKSKLPDKYKKDTSDNMNRVYKAKEKKN